jgi:hypothetical protein
MFSVVGPVKTVNTVFWVDIIVSIVVTIVVVVGALVVVEPLVTRTLGTKHKPWLLK